MNNTASATEAKYAIVVGNDVRKKKTDFLTIFWSLDSFQFIECCPFLTSTSFHPELFVDDTLGGHAIIEDALPGFPIQPASFIFFLFIYFPITYWGNTTSRKWKS